MTTTKTDDQLVQEINDYLAAHPYASTAEIRRKLSTHSDRMKRLEREGRIKLPPKRTLSMAGTRSAKLAKAAGRIFTI
jgi:Mn-dependent DtxR family transcriptional regulator